MADMKDELRVTDKPAVALVTIDESGAILCVNLEAIQAVVDENQLLKQQLTQTQQALDKKKDEVQALWMLLDDIDTLDDAARENDVCFRKECYEIQQKRWLIADPFSMAIEG